MVDMGEILLTDGEFLTDCNPSRGGYQGRDFEITLQKYKDNVVKARIDRSGPYKPSERPYNETYLNRK